MLKAFVWQRPLCFDVKHPYFSLYQFINNMKRHRCEDQTSFRYGNYNKDLKSHASGNRFCLRYPPHINFMLGHFNVISIICLSLSNKRFSSVLSFENCQPLQRKIWTLLFVNVPDSQYVRCMNSIAFRGLLFQIFCPTILPRTNWLMSFHGPWEQTCSKH